MHLGIQAQTKQYNWLSWRNDLVWRLFTAIVVREDMFLYGVCVSVCLTHG